MNRSSSASASHSTPEPKGDPRVVRGLGVMTRMLLPATRTGLEFLARVDIEKDGKGQDRNVVKIAVEPDHPDYAKLMGVPPKAPGSGHSGAPAQAAAPAYQAPAPQRAPVTGKPSWAQ